MVSIFQQNKNQFNKVSALISSETKKNMQDPSSFIIERNCILSVIPGEVFVPRCRIEVLVHPSSQIKIVEVSNKVFWCWEVLSGDLNAIGGSHLYRLDYKDPSGVEDSSLKLAMDMINPDSRFSRYYHYNISDYSGGLEKSWGHLTSAEKERLTKESEIYKAVVKALSNIKYDISIHIKREGSILKSIKNDLLFPVIWYYEGAYNVQTERNFSYSPSTAGRRFEMIGPGYRYSLKDAISLCVRYANFNNWSYVDVSSPYLKSCAHLIND